MSSAVIALPAAASAKSPKKRAKKKTGPTVSTRILKAVTASSERGGLSLAALKKVLQAGGYDVMKNKARILVAIKRLVTKKSLVQTKGSFKLNKKPPRPRKKRVMKKKKPKAKRARKRTSVKKAAGTPAKKSPKKKRKAKSPKKAKKPAAAKKSKKPKSPKKTRAKVSRTRTRAAKK